MIKHWQMILNPLKWFSYLILLMFFVDFLSVGIVGKFGFGVFTGIEHVKFHQAVVFMGFVSIATVLNLQKRFSFISKWYFVASICAVLFWAWIFLYGSVEDIYGLHGVNNGEAY